MNILFISETTAFSNERFGGAESSLKLLSEKLIDNEQEVFYLTRQKKRHISSSLPKGLKIKYYPFFRGAGKISLIGSINKFFLSNKVQRVVQNNNIDIIYCYYQLDILKALKKVKKVNPKVKIVMRMAGMYWYEKSKSSQKILREYEKAFNFVDSVNYIHPALELLTNKKIKELDMNVNFKHKFYLDIGTSFSFDRLVDYSTVTKKNKVFKMVMATRFSNYQKRQDIIVNAAKLINKKLDFQITFVGNGSEKDKIQDLIYKLDLDDRVKIIPFLEQKHLWKLMQESDLLIHACEYEGLGKIIIESMAMGLPVLASNVTPINKYIEDGNNGFLVKNDSELWAKKLKN